MAIILLEADAACSALIPPPGTGGGGGAAGGMTNGAGAGGTPVSVRPLQQQIGVVGRADAVGRRLQRIRRAPAPPAAA